MRAHFLRAAAGNKEEGEKGLFLVLNDSRGFEDDRSPIEIDSDNNIYVTCNERSNSDGRQQVSVIKINEDGGAVWDKQFSRTNTGFIYAESHYDGTHLYVVMQYFNPARTYVVKLDTDGAIQWSRELSMSNRDVRFAPPVNKDNSGNVLVSAQSEYPNFNDWYSGLFKLSDSTGAPIDFSGTREALRYGRSSDFYYPAGAVTDSNGNIYQAGFRTSGTDRSYIIKYNSSGSRQLEREFYLGSGSYNTRVRDIQIGSNGNIYMIGSMGSSHLFIFALTPTFSTHLYRVYAMNSLPVLPRIRFDSNGNYYVMTNNDPSAYNNGAVVMKFNSSNAQQWQRQIHYSGRNFQTRGLAVNDTHFAISGCDLSIGSPYTFDQFFVAMLPGDGSKTGTYGSSSEYIYTTATFNTISASGSISSTNRGVSNLPFNDAAGNISNSNADVTVNQLTTI